MLFPVFDGLALFFLMLVLYFGVRNRKPRVDLCGLVNHPSHIAKVRRENSKPSVRCGVFYDCVNEKRGWDSKSVVYYVGLQRMQYGTNSGLWGGHMWNA